MQRIIMHYDMDCFYASVEIRDNPKYKNKPLVVGERIVTTASYEARKYGVHSAMTIYEAKKLCPNLIITSVNKEKYIEISEKIQSLIQKITEKCEFIALDEGYIDLTGITLDFESAKKFAEKFKKRIYFHTNLTCSVGIGYNKMSSKLASGINKPNGVYIFTSEEEFVNYTMNKDIKIIQGVGKKFLIELNKNKIYKVRDIFNYSLKELVTQYGKSRGELLYLASKGVDYSEIDYKKSTHSIGHENTYRYPLVFFEVIQKEMTEIFERSYERLLENDFLTRTIILKIKYIDDELITRSKTLKMPTDNRSSLILEAEELLENIEFDKKVRLVGVAFGNLTKKSIRQLSLL